MKLTGTILAKYLSEQFPIRQTNRLEESRGLEGALFCHAPEQMQEVFAPEWAYILEVRNWEMLLERAACFNGAGLLILAGKAETDEPQKDLRGVAETPYLLLDCDSPETVMNAVTRIFACLRSWEERLLQIQYRPGSAREMLEASLEVFDNPLLVLDDSLSVVTSAKLPGENAWEEVFAPGREKMDLLRSLSRDADFQESRSRHNVYRGPDEVLGLRSLCWNVFRGGSANYMLAVIQENRPLTACDGDLLELLGTHVKYVLFHQEHALEEVSSRVEPVLLRILQDRSLDYREGSRLLEHLGWKGTHRYMALVYELAYLDQDALPALSICRYMQEQYRSCCSFSFEGQIVTFFNLSLSSIPEEEIRMQLKPFIRDSYLKAGFSRAMSGHMDLRRQYLQARAALETGKRKYPYQWIHDFNQIALAYILEQSVRSLSPRMLVHEGVLRLEESDRSHGTEYIKTLSCYLRHHQNAVQTAKELFIHRSTFLYRMEKIRALLESSLEDPEEVLYLMLSLALLEQRE